MHNAAGALLLLLPLLPCGAQTTAEWRLSGYALNLFTRSETLFPERERFVLDLSRLRLRIDGRLAEYVAVDVQYDNELLLGSYLNTQLFAVVNTRGADATFDLERTYAEGQSVLVRHRLYRGTVAISSGGVDVILGRQRIAWGTGRFWSPLDILNPFDATRVERDERSGVDAALLERRLGALGKVNVVYAPNTRRSRAAAAGYLHGNARGTDYSIIVGSFRGDRVVGVDFATRAGGLGVRGEATGTRAESGGSRRFLRALLGADYGFRNTLTLTVELYYNGQGASAKSDYDLAALLDGRVQSLASRYAAAAASYEVTPLLKLLAYGVVNIDDLSIVVWPGFEYSVSSNLTLGGGIQHFTGGDS
ncbi:MAG: hypothetical protein AB1762_21885, partial [Gemmatimonadota bacterium]